MAAYKHKLGGGQDEKREKDLMAVNSPSPAKGDSRLVRREQH